MTDVVITFGALTLPRPSQPVITPVILTRKTRVFGTFSGGVQQVNTNIQTAQGNGVNVVIKCTTDTLTDYTNIKAAVGTAATLTLAYSETYTNMQLMNVSQRKEIGYGVWEYVCEFEQQTA